MTDETIELRPFPPFLPPQATVLMMGSFPPAKEKRGVAFHYPNFQKDMWGVYGLVFFGDAAYFQVPGRRLLMRSASRRFSRSAASAHVLACGAPSARTAMRPTPI